MILAQHDEQRRLFAFIQEMRGGDAAALEAVWTRLQGLLDAHAEGEERFFYPELLKLGDGAADATSARAETRDAIADHNQIRDAAKAVDKQEAGTEAWFAAVARADCANSKHMAEEERQGLADFRYNSTVRQRHELGAQFLAFVSRHLTGVKPVDKDPDAYVENPPREMESAGS